MRTLVRISWMILALFASAQAHAERYALVIGVSTYLFLSGDRQLQGPRNDAEMMRTVLQRKGFKPDAIQTLADGVSGAELPTRVAILQALDGLAAKAKVGDFVFLYFSGHGSQMPSDKSIPAEFRKPDGRQEIFLPRDARQWDANLGRVTNSIVDYELTERVDAIRARGAFVWAVVDACQSATLVRGASGPADQHIRHVETSELGIPQDVFDAATSAAANASAAATPVSPSSVPGTEPTRGGSITAASERGGYVAFYAAQTNQPAKEEPMPAGQPQRIPHGVFSYTIASALASIDGISYRQLGEFVLAQYMAQNRTIPTPLYTGTHLDAPMFGVAAKGPTPVHQWPIARNGDSLSIDAGMLNQLAEGAVLEVVASPIAGDDAAIGYLRVLKAEVLAATLAPIAFNGKPMLDLAKLPAGAYARMSLPAVDLTLRVLPPAAATTADAKAALAAIDALRKQPPTGIDIQWVKAGQPYDLALRAEDGRLWLVPASGQFARSGVDRTPSIGLARPDVVGELSNSLLGAGRALNLVRIAAVLQTSATARGLRVTMSVKRDNKVLPLGADNVSPLLVGDQVEVTLENTNRDIAIDVTALYVDADYGIQPLFPLNGASNRLAGAANSSGGTRQSFSFNISDGTIGLERLVLIAIEERANGARYDFSYLAQRSIERTRSAADEINSVFDAAGFGAPADATTRGDKPKAPGRTQMAVYSFRVQPSRAAGTIK